jgi:hypothetical protein
MKFNEKKYMKACKVVAQMVDAMVEEDMKKENQDVGRVEEIRRQGKRQELTEDYLAAAYKEVEEQFNLHTWNR